MRVTRYHRAEAPPAPGPEADTNAAAGDLFNRAGFALVVLDHDPPRRRHDLQGGHEQVAGHRLGHGARLTLGRKHADGSLLTFTSGSLPADVHVLGFPIVTMRLATSGPDGAVYVYVEDVDPDGDVSYLTEGCLRFLHRRTAGPGLSRRAWGRIALPSAGQTPFAWFTGTHGPGRAAAARLRCRPGGPPGQGRYRRP